MARTELNRLQLETALLAAARQLLAVPEVQRRAVLLEAVELAVLRAAEPATVAGPATVEAVRQAGPRLAADRKELARVVLRMVGRLEKALAGTAEGSR